MGVEDLLDLAREELLAAAVDHLLEAADDAQASVRIDHAEIAAAEPAVGQEGFGVGGRVVVIAEMHRGPVAADVALLARRARRAPRASTSRSPIWLAGTPTEPATLSGSSVGRV